MKPAITYNGKPIKQQISGFTDNGNNGRPLEPGESIQIFDSPLNPMKALEADLLRGYDDPVEFQGMRARMAENTLQQLQAITDEQAEDGATD